MEIHSSVEGRRVIMCVFHCLKCGFPSRNGRNNPDIKNGKSPPLFFVDGFCISIIFDEPNTRKGLIKKRRTKRTVRARLVCAFFVFHRRDSIAPYPFLRLVALSLWKSGFSRWKRLRRFFILLVRHFLSFYGWKRAFSQWKRRKQSAL